MYLYWLFYVCLWVCIFFIVCLCMCVCVCVCVCGRVGQLDEETEQMSSRCAKGTGRLRPWDGDSVGGGWEEASQLHLDGGRCLLLAEGGLELLMMTSTTITHCPRHEPCLCK